jgi:Putative SAM-dependent methyltransferase
MTFGAISTVLKSLDESGFEEHGDLWDDLVAERLASLEASYRILRDRDRELIDYSDISTQAAYVFMYAIGRAEFTFQIIDRFSAELDENLFADGHLRVSSIGGGPGSELAGLVKFLESDACDANITRISYQVFDKEQNWENIVEAVRDALETEIEIDLVFELLDVEDTQACQTVNLADQHLVMMSFFISEVCEIQNRNNVIASLNHLLGTISPGAHLLYNDNDAYSFYTFINARTNAARRFNQRGEIQDVISICAPRFDDIFNDMIERFDRTPHLNSKAVAKLFQRQGI